MAPLVPNRKRKAVTRDAPLLAEAVKPLDLPNGNIDGTLSEDEGGSERLLLDGDVSASERDETDEDDLVDEDIGSDEIPSEEDEKDLTNQLRRSTITNVTEGGRRKTGRIRGDSISNDGPASNVDSQYGDDQGVEENYTTMEDANGGIRYIYPEIDPVYDSDDSDVVAGANTVGNIPSHFYDTYPHIGYDINGNKIMRPAKGEALDALLDSIELPKGWTGLTDPNTGKPLNLTQEELDVLRRITRSEVHEDGYDPYPDMVEYFTGKEEIMPLSAAPEPKRRFVPSKHEGKRIMKMVKAIREGRIQPYKASSGQEDDEQGDVRRYDLWADEVPRPDHPMNLPAPKLPPPGYDESYHPPPEYLPDEEERKAWENAEEEERTKDYLPTNYDTLRRVPGYNKFVKDKFERCLDLYLAPRVRRTKNNIDPESLLPKLPNPDELRPFPTTCATVYRGHEGRVRTVAIDPAGIWLASGGDDGTVRIWELLTGRQIWVCTLGTEEAVNVVRWRPTKDASILAAAAGENVFLIVPSTIISPELEQASRGILDAGWGYATTNPLTSADGTRKEPPAQWNRPGDKFEEQGIFVKITVRSTVKVINWHRRGDYFATVAPRGLTHAIAIHTLSKHLTQLPFRRLKGLAQSAQFHPSKPIFFVATQRTIRSYDLARQELLKILQPGARWISAIDVHPGGDNLIVGSYDKRLLWHDLDLSTKPYKTLRYHTKAIRAVKFHHGGLPLFADASDDGSLQIFHGKVVGDLMENATIVPLKVLRGHAVVKELGVMDLDWHPRESWCVSAGADGTCRLWN